MLEARKGGIYGCWLTPLAVDMGMAGWRGGKRAVAEACYKWSSGMVASGRQQKLGTKSIMCQAARERR